MLDNLGWESGFPTDTAGHNCVGLVKSWKLVNTPCEEDDYYSDGLEGTKPGLAYVCEARVLYNVEKTKACYFPFTYDGKQYSSCARGVIVSGFNPDGEPWCVTKVDDNGEALEADMVMCQDEAQIIYKNSGRGLFCELPFLRDHVYHDYCTRKGYSAPEGLINTYWCPNPPEVDPGNVYVFGKGVGFCTENLYPPGKNPNLFASSSSILQQYLDNGCPETYEPLTDEICVRVSAYQQTFHSAQAKCQSEGSHLLEITSQEMHVSEVRQTEYQNNHKSIFIQDGAATVLANAYRNLDRFDNVDTFWLGAKFDSATEEWSWTVTRETFTDFTKWDNDEADIGCFTSGCTNADGIVLRSAYSSGSDSVTLYWNALVDKSIEKPYICQSECPRGYLWYQDQGWILQWHLLLVF